MKGTSLVFAVCLLICGLTCSSSANPKPLKVTVDPRMELLSAVQFLSSYQAKHPGLITTFDFPYKQKMAEYFGKYKDHRAVKLFDGMSWNDCGFDASVMLMLCLSDPPDLALRDPSSCLSREHADYVMKWVGEKKRLGEFVGALREFARDTDFQKFFEANADTYKAIIDAADGRVHSLDVIGPLQDYYGSSRRLLATIVLAPLFQSGGYGPKVERSDGALEVFDICGPSGVQGSQPSWGAPKDICELAWHEFGHSFVNPLADKNEPALSKYSSLFNPIASPMRGQGYDNWQICVYEHLIGAVVARIIYKTQGSKAAEECVEGESQMGFAYIKPLCKRLEDYEKHRDKYPTLESFFPELIGVFKSLHESLCAEQLGPDIYGMKIEIGEPGISPDGARIAYPLLGLDKNGEWVSRVWVSDLAGSSGKRIAQVPYLEGSAPPYVAWFDDSHVIVSAPYTNLIQIVSLDGKQRSISIPDSFCSLGLALSPNKKWGAFSTFSKQPQQRGGVFLVDIETGAVRALSHDTMGVRLSWSPDSSKLAFGESGDPGQLYKGDYPPSFAHADYRNVKICDVETGTVTDTGLKGTGVAWSPDGKWLAYTGNAVGGRWGYGVPQDGSIVSMNVVTKETKTLTKPGVYKRTDNGLDISGSLLPLWSPDGRRIAYRRIHWVWEGASMRTEREIWLMNADGTGCKKLKDEWSPFTWAPDGKALLVSMETGIERIAVDTD